MRVRVRVCVTVQGTVVTQYTSKVTKTTGVSQFFYVLYFCFGFSSCFKPTCSLLHSFFFSPHNFFFSASVVIMGNPCYCLCLCIVPYSTDALRGVDVSHVYQQEEESRRPDIYRKKKNNTKSAQSLRACNLLYSIIINNSSLLYYYEISKARRDSREQSAVYLIAYNSTV